MKRIKHLLKKNWDSSSAGLDALFFIALIGIGYLSYLILPKEVSPQWMQSRIFLVALFMLFFYLLVTLLYSYFKYLQLKKFKKIKWKYFIKFVVMNLIIFSTFIVLIVVYSIIFSTNLSYLTIPRLIFEISFLIIMGTLLQTSHFIFIKDKKIKSFLESIKLVVEKPSLFKPNLIIAGWILSISIIIIVVQRIIMFLLGVTVNKYIYYADQIFLSLLFIFAILLIFQKYRSMYAKLFVMHR